MVDEVAIADLYRRYGHTVLRRCQQLVSNEEDARELMQETFYQFWKGRDRFEGRASPFTYLYRIATNLSIDKLRRRRTAGVQVEVDQANVSNPGRNRPDEQAMAAHQLAELTVGLDEDVLTVAVMAFVDGLTQEEIAAALELSRRTIGKRLKRFKEHTRKRAARLDRTSPPAVEAKQAHGN